MPTVFLSHASADAPAAKAVAEYLRNAGLDVWLELNELTAGPAWIPALEAALEASTHFIVLVGPSGVQRWVEREVRYALVRNTEHPEYAVIPLLLGADTSEESLPLFLRQHQALRLPDWHHPDAATIQQVAAAILAAPPLRVNVLAPGESPFLGLYAFGKDNAHLFFGRDDETEDLRQRIANGVRLLPVVGASGSGKSSIVLAGLIPSLLRGRPGTFADWRIAMLKPDKDPLGSLARALPNLNPELSVSERDQAITVAGNRLPSDGTPLANILAAIGVPAESRQLLVIDQFEQLFTLAAPPDAARFIEILLGEAARESSRLQIVFTLRADFFGQCHPYVELWIALTENQYTLRRPDRNRLREIITKPLALAGRPISDDLADALIEDAMAPGESGESARLPLLEHALDRLWAESRGKPPDATHYNQIGRLKGAIRQHAGRVLQEELKTAAERDLARRIFIELTALGEGAGDTARRVPKPKLESLGPGAGAVLQKLAGQRLVDTGSQEDNSVTIAHEALIREWPDLRDWLDTGRQDILLGRELQRVTDAWLGAGRDQDLLLRGGPLQQALQWRSNHRSEASGELNEFLDASRHRDRRDRRLRWISVTAVMGLLLLLALPTIARGWHDLRRNLSGKVNPKDGLRYVEIPPGEFEMGCSDGDESCEDDESPPGQKRRKVKLTRGFWIGQTEVTQAAFSSLMKGENPSMYKGGQLPVENVTWEEATKYCGAAGMRLPTEAEWEYAARAGSRESRYGELARISSTSPFETVGGKEPNAWSLYDMLGGVWEWTNDWHGPYASGTAVDPTGPGKGGEKVLRGGSWGDIPELVRVWYRVRCEPTYRSDRVRVPVRRGITLMFTVFALRGGAKWGPFAPLGTFSDKLD